MMERQAIAIERIVNHLNIAPASKNRAEEPKETTEPLEKSFEHHYVTPQHPERL